MSTESTEDENWPTEGYIDEISRDKVYNTATEATEDENLPTEGI